MRTRQRHWSINSSCSFIITTIIIINSRRPIQQLFSCTAAADPWTVCVCVCLCWRCYMCLRLVFPAPAVMKRLSSEQWTANEKGGRAGCLCEKQRHRIEGRRGRNTEWVVSMSLQCVLYWFLHWFLVDIDCKTTVKYVTKVICILFSRHGMSSN